MKIETFGQLLEKMLYLSNQKKGSLAKHLGYDVSYISKWINEKNLPTQKSFQNICKMSAEFIVNSLTTSTSNDIKSYFEIEDNTENQKILTQYIERSLKEAYNNTAKKNSPKVYKNTYSEEYYNSLVHINPSLRKKYLSKDAGVYLSKTGNLDVIISTNLYKINQDDKMAVVNLKEELYEISQNGNIRVRMIMGLENEAENLLFDTMSILKMITSYSNIDFQIYNLDLNPNAIISVIKNRIFHSATLDNEGKSLFTSMSKEKEIVEEMYYSLENTMKNRSLEIVESKKPEDIIKEKMYIHYIMGQNLKILMGSINELFMPPELFKEVSEQVFGYDSEILKELNQINVFLNKVTYLSKMDVLIYEEELKRYISSGELSFFNHTVKLNFRQVESHINNIKRIAEQSENIKFKLIEGRFVYSFKNNWYPSLYLSRGFKLTKTEPVEDKNDYLIIKDNTFKRACEKMFDEMWSIDSERIIQSLEDVQERLGKLLSYTRVVNGDFEV